MGEGFWSGGGGEQEKKEGSSRSRAFTPQFRASQSGKKTCGMNPSSGGLSSELSQCTRKQPNFPRSRSSDNAAKSL